MYSFETTKRVLYGETDKMGYVYYGNYPLFYEKGRVECMRSLGVSYKGLEDSGIMMPVLDMNIKYIKPVKYDDLVRIKTTILEVPGVRIKFKYELFLDDVLVNLGTTTLVFVSIAKQKPVNCPANLLTAIEKSFF